MRGPGSAEGRRGARTLAPSPLQRADAFVEALDDGHPRGQLADVDAVLLHAELQLANVELRGLDGRPQDGIPLSTLAVAAVDPLLEGRAGHLNSFDSGAVLLLDALEKQAMLVQLLPNEAVQRLPLLHRFFHLPTRG